MKKIVDFFEQEKVLKQRKQEIIDLEKNKVKEQPLSYITSYIGKTDNLLTVSEVKKCLEESEHEAQGAVSATKYSIYISEFAAKNYTEALQKLDDIKEARETLQASLNSVTVSYFNENLADTMAKYEQEIQEHESNQLTIEPSEVSE